MHLAIALAAAATCSAAPTCQIEPDARGNVVGMVRDHAGTPIAGASVRLVARFENPDPFAASAEALLRGHPLPAARSNRDGTFVLAVLPDLREVARLGLSWSLVVERDGYEVWNEHLSRGLVDYLGSEVTLRPLDPDDEVEFIAEGALPGTGVVVMRGHDVRFVPFDHGGRARARLPRLPCPLQAYSGGAVVDTEWYVRASPPGFTSAPGLSRRRHRLTPTEVPRVRLTRTDGATPTHARALLRAVGGNRWVDLPDAQWPGSTPLAFLADGCRMGARAVLHPLPTHAPRTLRVVDEAGAPVAGAQAMLVAAEHWRPRVHTVDHHPPPGEQPGVTTLWRRPLRADSQGVLDLGDALAADVPAVLVVLAEAFEPAEVLDPRGLDDGADLTLARRATASLEVFVHDEHGQPIAGALVCLSDAADAAASLRGERRFTATDGRVICRGLVPGAGKVFALESSRVGSHEVDAKADATTLCSVQLAPASSLGFVVRDPDGRPVPFFGVLLTGRQPIGNGRATRDYVCVADSMGRVRMSAGVEQIAAVRNALELIPPEQAGSWGELRVARPEPVFLRQRPDQRFRARIELRRAGTMSVTRPMGDIVVVVSDDDELLMHLQPRGVVFLDNARRRALPLEPGSGVRVWEVDFPALHLEFTATGPDPERLIAVPAIDTNPDAGLDRFGPRFLTLPAETAIFFRPEDASWRLSADTRRLRFLHPRHAPLVVELTEAQARGEAPIRLALVPGSPLTVEVARGHAEVVNVAVTVARKAESGDPFIVRHEFERIGAKAATPDAEPSCTVELPALSGGAWKVAVECFVPDASGKATQRMTFAEEVVADGTRAVIVRAPL